MTYIQYIQQCWKEKKQNHNKKINVCQLRNTLNIIIAELMYKLYIHFSSIYVGSYANLESTIYSNSRQNAPQEPYNY